MKHIVITGGSRGIGFGLAKEFLKRGNRVTISGRKSESLELAVEKLSEVTGNGEIKGFQCNVTSIQESEILWQEAVTIAPVDIWINNAGINHDTHKFNELDLEKVLEVINTNISGTAIASHIVINKMIEQGHGTIYNMEGFGSDGRKIDGMSVYGLSKRAIRYFSRSLALEYRNSTIQIGSISPGMVLTDMILEPIRLRPEESREAIKIFNILSDTVETVTPWLVDKILKNKKQGTHIAWLTGRKITSRFIGNIFVKRRVPGLPSVSTKNR